jgi:hypothetical protein
MGDRFVVTPRSVLLFVGMFYDPTFCADGVLYVTGMREHTINGKQRIEADVERRNLGFLVANGYWTLVIQDGFGWCSGDSRHKRDLSKVVQIVVEDGVRGSYHDIIDRARAAHRTGNTSVKYDSLIDGPLMAFGCENCVKPAL